MSMSKKSSDKLRIQKTVKSALWSVKAEGLKPTKSATTNLNKYASGRITVSEMRSIALKNARTIANSSR